MIRLDMSEFMEKHTEPQLQNEPSLEELKQPHQKGQRNQNQPEKNQLSEDPI